MHDREKRDDDVLRFVQEEIDSVPELEALLLVWQQRPRAWSAEQLAGRLYIRSEQAREILIGLTRKQLISAGAPETYLYEDVSTEQDQLMAHLEETYRREIVRISNLIHSKPSSAVRDFARAFRFTKEKG